MAFTQKLLRFSLSGGDAGSMNLSGLRAHVDVHFPGGTAMSTAAIAIWGMTLSEMNALSTFGNVPTAFGKTQITVEAGERDRSGKETWSTVFKGSVTNAYPDFLGNAEAVMHIMAAGGLQPALKAAEPTTFQGEVDGAQVLQQIAGQAGYQFENNGVKVKISNPYLPGTLREQMLAIVGAMGCEWNGMENGVVAIWPAGKSRSGGGAVVSPQTGMIGYPGFTEKGIFVRTLYNASLRIGQMMTVRSDLAKAARDWKIYSIDVTLDTKIPGGQWFEVVYGTWEGYVGAPPV